MKIRTGFVSNSSSSSFCIYGIHIQENELQDLFGTEDIDSLDLSYETYDTEYNGYWIGEEVTLCKDDQTMGDFKKEVRKKINDKALTPFDNGAFHFYSESWYDG